MLKKVVAGIAIMGTAAGFTGGIPASAESTPLLSPWQDPNSVFEVREEYGGTCGPEGFSFRDGDNYSFDNGGSVQVDGTYIGVGATAFDLTTVGADALATYPVTTPESVGDLAVSVSYRITSDNIVRTMVTITNTGTTDAADVPVTIESSPPDSSRIYYVDGGTWRSSGGWFVMGDDDPAVGDYSYPPSFHAPDGPGSPLSPATIAVCDGTLRNLQAVESVSISTSQLVFGYRVDIPAGETRRIVVFQGSGLSDEESTVIDTVATVTQKGQSFNPAGQTPGSGILSDLSCDDALTVVNWVFTGCGGDDDSRGPFFDFSLDPYQEAVAEGLPDTL